MEKEIKITVYADLNCPYCYVLNERLIKLNCADAVIWKPIEHAPDLHAHSFAEKDRQELTAEVSDVKAKARDVRLELPSIRPNSRRASELLATITRDFPEKAVEFRTAVCRALWLRGEDFSDPDILEQLLISCGLSHLQVTSTASEDLLNWHNEWEFGEFARNVPSLESNAGYKMLGSPPLEQLKLFLQDGKSEVTNFDDAACVASARYSIAVISGEQRHWQKPKLLEAISNYQFYTSVDDLKNSLNEQSNLDLIVLNDIKEDPLNNIRQLKDSIITQHVPTVFLTNDQSKKTHINAYRAGISDIFSCDENEEILGHRIIRLLHSKRHTDKLYEIARIDALTGLYNRREFDEVLNKEWTRTVRGGNKLSLLMIDVDEFKAYNDTYGHSMGDVVLRRIAEIIKSCVSRPTDMVARYGGEEFSVILMDTDIKGARLIAELVRAQIAIHNIKHRSSSVKPYLTISIGVGEAIKSKKKSKDDFISVVDKALYKAKKNGRDQVVLIE